MVQTNCHLSWGIDSFTLQWSSYPFFFSIRDHSMRFGCTFCKKADFLDKDLSKCRWISRSLRFHPMKLCGNIMIHFFCRFIFWFCEWDWCHDIWWKNILTCWRKILNLGKIISHSKHKICFQILLHVNFCEDEKFTVIWENLISYLV